VVFRSVSEHDSKNANASCVSGVTSQPDPGPGPRGLRAPGRPNHVRGHDRDRDYGHSRAESLGGGQRLGGSAIGLGRCLLSAARRLGLQLQTAECRTFVEGVDSRCREVQ
jgi:hypothetical protein